MFTGTLPCPVPAPHLPKYPQHALLAGTCTLSQEAVPTPSCSPSSLLLTGLLHLAICFCVFVSSAGLKAPKGRNVAPVALHMGTTVSDTRWGQKPLRECQAFPMGFLSTLLRGPLDWLAIRLERAHPVSTSEGSLRHITNKIPTPIPRFRSPHPIVSG